MLVNLQLGKMTKLIFLSILCLLLLNEAKSHEEDLCIPVRRDIYERNRPEVPPGVVQGHPGKRGSVGAPGQKGEGGISGPPGLCACDPSEVDVLRGQIRELQDSITDQAESLRILKRIHRTEFSDCNVGMKDGRIEDDDITASSHHEIRLQPKYGRLDNTVRPQFLFACWAARQNTIGQWIQVDLRTPTYITGVVTQGRNDVGQWVTSYKISYGNSTNQLQVVQNNNQDMIFQANRDSDTHVTNMLPHPIVARYFRLVVQTWNGHTSLRMEILTC